MNKQKITISNREDGQIRVIIFPDKEIKSRKNNNEQKITNEIDIIELNLTDIDGNIMPLRMTPDEALEISGLLCSAVSFYMKEFNKEYKELFTNKIKRLEKNRKARKKLINNPPLEKVIKVIK